MSTRTWRFTGQPAAQSILSVAARYRVADINKQFAAGNQLGHRDARRNRKERKKSARKSEDRFTADERWGVFDDGGETMMAAGSVNTRLTRFGGKYLRTLAVGGLGTLPEYRRQGCVRFLFEEAFKLAPERGWVVSLLHPFSFSYYRKFGYEKIADHKILEFPMAALACFERRSDFKRLDSEDRLGDALNVFERFGANRNILFKRYDARNYNLKPENEPATLSI